MAIEVVGFYRDNESLYDECKKCISYYSILLFQTLYRIKLRFLFSGVQFRLHLKEKNHRPFDNIPPLSHPEGIYF